METSRLLCIDSLWSGIERHIVHRISKCKVSTSECCDALEFAAVNKIETLLECLLVHMNPNHLDTELDERLEKLSMVAVMSLLTGDFVLDIEDVKFGIFLIWIKKNEVDSDTKRNMLDTCDLK